MKNMLPLYTGEIVGNSWSNNKKYHLVIITKWSDRTATAKEVEHKFFCFSDLNYLRLNIRKESWCEFIYESYPRYTIFNVENNYHIHPFAGKAGNGYLKINTVKLKHCSINQKTILM